MPLRTKLHIVAGDCATHKHPMSQPGWRRTRGSRCTSRRLRVVAEHGRDLLRRHHPAGDPPRQLHLGQGPHHRHRDLNQRVERPLPARHLDQDPRPVNLALRPGKETSRRERAPASRHDAAAALRSAPFPERRRTAAVSHPPDQRQAQLQALPPVLSGRSRDSPVTMRATCPAASPMLSTTNRPDSSGGHGS